MERCILANGTPRIWKQVQQGFPSTREILGYYHGSSYLHPVAQNQYADTSQQTLKWTQATIARLFCGDLAQVLESLAQMLLMSQSAAGSNHQLLHRSGEVSAWRRPGGCAQRRLSDWPGGE